MKKLRRLVSALILLSLTILTALPPIHVANAQAFTRVGALTLSPGQNVLHASVIDNAAGFAYFGSFTSPAIVVKVRLSDFSRVGSLTLNPGEDNVSAAIIDPTVGFAYFATDTSPGIVVKVRLSNFTRVGSLTFNPGEDKVKSSVIDPAAGFAYFATGSSMSAPRIIVKVRLSNFTRVGSLTPGGTGNELSASVIDPAAGFAYFGTVNTFLGGAGIVKVRLSDFTVDTALILNPGEVNVTTAIIDPTAGFAYFGTGEGISNPGIIVKVRLSDFTRVGSLTLNPGENYPESAVIDSVGVFAYFGTDTSPGIVVRVRLSDLTRIDAVTLNPGESFLFSSVIDPSAGFAYFGTNTLPGIVVKVGIPALPDFSISAQPHSVTFRLGLSGVSSVNLTSKNGFSGPISLSASSSSPSVSASFSPNPVNLNSTGSLASTMTISSTVAGTYNITVTGRSGSIIHTTTVTAIIQTFDISNYPSFLYVVAGSSSTSTIMLTSVNGFADYVSLSSTIQGPSSSSFPQAQLTPSQIPLTGSASSTLTFSTSSGTVPGTYNVTVTGTASFGRVNSTNVLVKVIAQPPDYSLIPSPSFLTIVKGSASTSTLTVSSLGGFTGTVTLSRGVSPGGTNSPTAGLSQTSITLSPGVGTSVLTVSTNPSTALGSYTVTINGTSGSLLRIATVSISIISALPDFSLSPNPSSLTIVKGSSAQSTITLSSSLGFSGNVSLTASLSTNAPNSPVVSLNKASLVLSANVNGTVVATVSTNSTTSLGTYAVIVAGSSGAISHTSTLSIAVVQQPPDFSTTANPSPIVIYAGSSSSTTFTLTSLRGFSGTVSLGATLSPTVSNGPSVTLNTNSILLSSTSSVNITISTITATPPGNYTIIVSAMSGSLSHPASIPLTVNPLPPDFTLSSSPGSLTILKGSSAASTITVTGLRGFSGTVALVVSVSPIVSNSPVGTLNVTSLTLPVNGTGASLLTISTSSQSSAGNYTVTITGTHSGVSRSATVSLTIMPLPADFSLSSNSASLIIIQGSSGTSSVSVSGLRGFSGTLVLGAVVSPNVSSGPAAQLNVTSLTIVVNGTRASGLVISTVAATSIGNYTVTITGTSVGLSHSISLTVGVISAPADFSLSATPGALTVSQASSGISTITLTGLRGFSGTITLSVSVVPTVSNGPGKALNMTSTTLSLNGSHNITLTVSTSTATPAGTYSVIVSGLSGALSHSVTLSLIVQVPPPPPPDFSLTVYPAALVIVAGSGSATTISLGSQQGFTGGVNLSASVSPQTSNTPSASPGPSLVALTKGGTGTAQLSVSTTISTPSGPYTVLITGTNGSLSHVVTVSVTVSTPTSPDFMISASPTSVLTVVGSFSSSLITVSGTAGFSGQVNLVASLSPVMGNGPVASLNVAALKIPFGPAQSLLTISALSTLTQVGSYTVNITGTSGPLSHTVTVSVIVAPTFAGSDFFLTTSPTPLTLLQGASGTSTVTVSSLGGFSGNVMLSITVSPSVANGPSVLAPIPNPLTLNGMGGSSTSTIVVVTSSNTPAMFYTIIVAGMGGGGLSHSASISLTVVAPPMPDFSIVSFPASLTVIEECCGSTVNASSTVSFSSFGGFAANLTVTASISPLVSNGPTLLVSPSTVTLPLGGSVVSTLSASARPSTPVGVYTITVMGAGGSQSHSYSFSLAVVSFPSTDFVLSANAGSLILPDGSSINSTATLTSVGGFSATVSSTASVTPMVANHPRATVFPSSIMLVGGSTATFTITVSADPSTPAGVYVVNITATSGPTSHSATVTVIVSVSPQEFTIVASTSTVTISSGSSGQALISLASLGGFGGNVMLNPTMSPSVFNGPQPSLSPGMVSLIGGGVGRSVLSISTVSSTPGAVYTVTVTAAGGGLTHQAILAVVVTPLQVPDFTIVATPSSLSAVEPSLFQQTITVTSLHGFSGTVSLTATVSQSSSPIGLLLNPSSVSVSPGGSSVATMIISVFATTPDGVYDITVNGCCSPMGPPHQASVSITLTQSQPDFAITLGASSLTVPAGSSGATVVTLTSYGLAGIVTLNASVTPTMPNGPVAFLSSVLVALPSGGNATVQLTIFPTTTSQVYAVTITGGVSGLSHRVSIPLVSTQSPSDFTIAVISGLGQQPGLQNGPPGAQSSLGFSSQPQGPLVLQAGLSANSAISLSSLGGFAGTVSVSATISPNPVSIAIAVSPTTFALASGGVGLLTLGISTSPSTPTEVYVVTVTGDSGGPTHQTSLSIVVVPSLNDFTMLASPNAEVIVAGTSGSSSILVENPPNAPPVSLVASISPSTPNSTLVLNPVTLSFANGPFASSSLALAVAVPGVYRVTVTGTSGGGLSHVVIIPVLVLPPLSDFSLSSSPRSITIVQGASAGSSVSISSSLNGFVTVALSVSVSPLVSGGPFGLLNPVSVTLTGNGAGSSILTLTTTGLTPTGNYTAVVTGVARGIARSVSIPIRVLPLPPDFSIVSNPPSVTVVQGSSANSTVTLTSLRGFAGSVGLTVSVSLSVSDGPAASLSTSLVALSNGGNAVSILRIATSMMTPTGSYVVNVNATSGFLSHTVSVQLTVAPPPPDFSLVPAPVSLVVTVGSSSSSLINATSIRGFTGNVALTVTLFPSMTNGPTGQLSPSTLALSANTILGSTLTILTTNNTPTGNYTVTVTGVNGGLNRTATISLKVVPLPPDFSLSSVPGSLRIVEGSAANSTITLTSLRGFAGTVTLTLSVSPTSMNGPIGSLSVITLTLASNGAATSSVKVSTVSLTPAGNFTMLVTGTSGGISRVTTIALSVVSPPPDFSLTTGTAPLTLVQGEAGVSTVSLTSLRGLAGNVTLTVSISPIIITNGPSPSLSQQSLVLTANGTGMIVLTVSTNAVTPVSNYTVTVTGVVAGLSHSGSLSVTVTLPPPDFSIVSNPGSLRLVQGSSGSSTITLTSLRGFSGSVSLNATVNPALTNGPTASLTLNTISLGVSGSSTLTVSSAGGTPIGNYTVAVNGLGNSLPHTVLLVVSIILLPPDFAIAAIPGFLVTIAGSSGTSSLTLTSQNGFSGIAGVALSSSPSVSYSPSYSLGPSPVSIPAGGSGLSTLTVYTTAGTSRGVYTVFLTASSGSLFHTTTVMVNITWPQPSPGTHDVAVTSLKTSTNFAYQRVPGNLVSVNVTVANLGTNLEVFAVTVQANSTSIGTVQVTVVPGGTMVVTFVWNAQQMNHGEYTLLAHASPVPGETNLSNNDLTSNTPFTVRLTGDVNGDCKVNIFDLTSVGGIFGQLAASPGFNKEADLNNDGIINIFDLSAVGGNFGAQC